jgi:tetratricopeptide (TPR) repeat protein
VKTHWLRRAGAGAATVAIVAGGIAWYGSASQDRLAGPAITSGAVAIANLDAQIAQSHDDAGAISLLLQRSRFLGDYTVFERVAELTETHGSTPVELLRRARARAAVHRFIDALSDIDKARRLGARSISVDSQRASVLAALGRAEDGLADVERAASSRPDFATHTALAGAYAALGRLDEADKLYARALDELDTTLPFPYAAIWFARGVMWSEQAGDQRRGAEMYAQALRYLPQYVAANIHMAEIEFGQGDFAAAARRLEPIAATSEEPEALAVLSEAHVRSGKNELGRREAEQAANRFESLLSRQPLAFADHAAEFYLRSGSNPERAYALARLNLSARQTRRAYLLAARAAEASRRYAEAQELKGRMQARFSPRAG